MNRVLFVCTANICRSPMAEGAFRKLLAQNGLAHRVEVDSAGTRAHPGGDPPDSRAQAAAAERGIPIAHLRSRRVTPLDFIYYDLILAMDHGHIEDLNRECPPDEQHRIRPFMEMVAGADIEEVPDPYFGSTRGFDRVLTIVEQGSEGLLRKIGSPLNPASGRVVSRSGSTANAGRLFRP